jgi:predicted nucleotide-binding protein
MAINPENISFLLDQLKESDQSNFASYITQIFNYLNDEIKDNPVYDKYELESAKWDEWKTAAAWSDWALPTSIENSKQLAYSLFKEISEHDNDWFVQFGLFQQSVILQNQRSFVDAFLGYFVKALNDILNANPEIEENTPKKINSQTAFIVHGHDNELKIEVQLLLNKAKVSSIVLHEQADRGRTIIDKLVGETEVAGYAIALLTPDDFTQAGTQRARQNVILEIGYFLGKLGKERLRMIVKGDIEIPSDLQGILYEKHDSGGAWKIKLLKEMQAVGIFVDLRAVIGGF